MVDMDKEGNEIKFWSSEFLVKKYLHLSDADIALNDKLKQEEIERLNLAGGEGGEDDGMGFESLLPEDKKLLLEMLQFAKERANKVNEVEEEKSDKQEEKPKKKSKKKQDEEE
jgi:hypothetical protein